MLSPSTVFVGGIINRDGTGPGTSIVAVLHGHAYKNLFVSLLYHLSTHLMVLQAPTISSKLP